MRSGTRLEHARGSITALESFSDETKRVLWTVAMNLSSSASGQHLEVDQRLLDPALLPARVLHRPRVVVALDPARRSGADPRSAG